MNKEEVLMNEKVGREENVKGRYDYYCGLLVLRLLRAGSEEKRARERETEKAR
jgi:hypothetical protein